MAGIVIFIRYFVNESDFESVYSDRRGNCQPIYISITDVVVVSRFEDVYAFKVLDSEEKDTNSDNSACTDNGFFSEDSAL